MKMMTMAMAVAVTASGIVPALVAPAAAQRHVEEHTMMRTTHSSYRDHGRTRQVCTWQYRHHHRMRVCRTVRYR